MSLVQYLNPCLRVHLPIHPGFVNCVNQLSGGALDPRQFEGSFFAFLRVVTGLYSLDSLGVVGMDNGPFRGCGICASIPGEGNMHRCQNKFVIRYSTECISSATSAEAFVC